MADYHYDNFTGTYIRKQPAPPKLSIGGSDACVGDSGGGLVRWVRVKRQGRVRYKAFLIGIVSRGSGCAYQDIPGIYTRLVYP